MFQESETGSWHIPIAGNDSESERTWLCVTRPGASAASSKLVNVETSENIEARGSCAPMSVSSYSDAAIARKRKERPS